MKTRPEGAVRYLPGDSGDLGALRRASAGCHGCALYEDATQTVFGAGPIGARLFLVGEEPGDHEDREGVPFVGPAGHLLHEAMGEAGIASEDVYLTNAVKHFKFERRGKLRLHKKPSASEVHACEPWLVAELQAVRPTLVVALGATAAQALLGPNVRVTRERGVPHERDDGLTVVLTVHPASILRATDASRRAEQRTQFVDDLRCANELAGSQQGP